MLPLALSNGNDPGGLGSIFVSAGPAAVPLPLRVLEPSGDQVRLLIFDPIGHGQRAIGRVGFFLTRLLRGAIVNGTEGIDVNLYI